MGGLQLGSGVSWERYYLSVTSKAGNELDINDILEKIAFLDQEVATLRQGYVNSNQHYTEALASLNSLTVHAAEAARRAAKAADLALKAAQKSALAARESASLHIVSAA